MNKRVEILRKTTEDLIAYEPTRISLRRPHPETRDPSGGFMPSTEPPSVKPIKDRYFVPIAEVGRTGMTDFIEVRGRRFELTHILVGPYDDDIQVNDYFLVNNKKYVVVRVVSMPYEIKAYVGQDMSVVVRSG